MGRAEGLIAVGLSWQILVLTLVTASPNGMPGSVLLYAIIGFVIVAVGAFLTAWEKKLAA